MTARQPQTNSCSIWSHGNGNALEWEKQFIGIPRPLLPCPPFLFLFPFLDFCQISSDLIFPSSIIQPSFRPWEHHGGGRDTWNPERQHSVPIIIVTPASWTLWSLALDAKHHKKVLRMHSVAYTCFSKLLHTLLLSSAPHIWRQTEGPGDGGCQHPGTTIPHLLPSPVAQ